MDLSRVSSNMDITTFKKNYDYTQELLKSAQKKSENNSSKPNNKAENNQSPASKIVLAKKGSPAYMKQFDTDNDGEITLEEFNKYCEENDISDNDKIKILQVMQLSNSNSKTINANLKKDDKPNDIDEKMVYAKKGDDKYNEEMDTNKNGVITYAEYIQYMQKHKDHNSNEDEFNTSYIAPEVDSTVEYEV